MLKLYKEWSEVITNLDSLPDKATEGGITMRRGIVVLLLIFGISFPAYGNTFHRYINGKVEAITDYSIVVSGYTYNFAGKVIYRVHDRTPRGSFTENLAGRSDVQAGQSVYVKVEGNTVYEVIIERWKR